MMEPFVFTANPARVVFGSATIANLGDELEALGVTRALVLTTDFQRDDGRRLLEGLGAGGAGLYSQATMHTPVEVTNDALSAMEDCGADGLVSLGGGSTIGLGKALVYRKKVPHVVIPTTYAGSEMTPILGQTDRGRKETLSTIQVLPDTVIYDVDLTLSLPRQLTVTSGVNALAHAVEALYAQSANPVLSILAEEGIRALTKALDALASGQLDDTSSRTDALYGAWLCATCLGLGGVALHHKLCHVLGGSFGLPHAETHTVVLPHALAFNAPSIPEAMNRLRRATGAENPAGHFFDIAKAAGVPTSLKELGMTEEGIRQAVEITLENPYFNPRPLEQAPLIDLLESAFNGARP